MLHQQPADQQAHAGPVAVSAGVAAHAESNESGRDPFHTDFDPRFLARPVDGLVEHTVEYLAHGRWIEARWRAWRRVHEQASATGAMSSSIRCGVDDVHQVAIYRTYLQLTCP